MVTTAEGRVIAVRPRSEGGFGVTIGPAPDLYWFTVKEPPKLGQLLSVRAVRAKRKSIGGADLAGSITLLDGVAMKVVPDAYATRVVAPAWLARVQKVMRRPLYRYQAEGAAWLCSQIASGTGAILGDEPGLGKTAQAVAAIGATNAFPAIVVCPASVKEHWAREFALANNAPKVTIIDGVRGRFARAHVYVINYDLLRAREQHLRQIKPRLYVLDEAQKVNNPKPGSRTHRAAVITRLVRGTTGGILLTGSPIEHRPAELWRLLHLVDRYRWRDYDEYHQRYCIRAPLEENTKSVRTGAGCVERVDELHALVEPHMLRRLKHQVLVDLPRKSRRSILLRLSDRDMSHYRRAEKDVVAWLRALGHGERARRAARAKSIVKFTMLRRVAALAKLRSAVPEYLSMWFGRRVAEPLVIFGYHRDVMLGVMQICRKLGVRISGIGGGESSAKRQRQVDAFNAGLADVFLAPIKAAGLGLNLQRASEALVLERVFSPQQMSQAEDRLHRIGQDRPVTITYLDAAGTVDQRLATILSEKQRLINAVIDDDALETVDALATKLELAAN